VVGQRPSASSLLSERPGQGRSGRVINLTRPDQTGQTRPAAGFPETQGQAQWRPWRYRPSPGYLIRWAQVARSRFVFTSQSNRTGARSPVRIHSLRRTDGRFSRAESLQTVYSVAVPAVEDASARQCELQPLLACRLLPWTREQENSNSGLRVRSCLVLVRLHLHGGTCTVHLPSCLSRIQHPVTIFAHRYITGSAPKHSRLVPDAPFSASVTPFVTDWDMLVTRMGTLDSNVRVRFRVRA
jgi:hypothetical protein